MKRYMEFAAGEDWDKPVRLSPEQYAARVAAALADLATVTLRSTAGMTEKEIESRMEFRFKAYLSGFLREVL